MFSLMFVRKRKVRHIIAKQKLCFTSHSLVPLINVLDIVNGVTTGVMDLRVELGRSSEWKETFHRRVVDSLALPPFNFNLTTRDKVGLIVVYIINDRCHRPLSRKRHCNPERVWLL